MFSFSCFVLLFVIYSLTTLSSVDAFVVHPSSHSTTTLASSPVKTTTTSLQFFKGLSDAFKNDDSLGEVKNAGLKNGPNINDQVTVNGKKVPGAVVGQKLTAVANKVRVKIPVNCNQGDCGTCTVKFNGRKVKACQTGLPGGKAMIQT